MEEKDRLNFLKEIKPHTDAIEKKHGIPSVAIMAQAALESGWGRKRIGNNLFGIKYSGTGKCQRVLTTEYSKNPNAFKEEDIKSMEKVGDKYRFKVWQDFADYDSIEDCIIKHNALLLSGRYLEARRWVYSPKRYLVSIWRLGYATDLLYGYKIIGATYKGERHYSIVDSVTRRLARI